MKTKPEGPAGLIVTVKLEVTAPAVAVTVAVPGARAATVQESVTLVGVSVTREG